MLEERVLVRLRHLADAVEEATAFGEKPTQKNHIEFENRIRATPRRRQDVAEVSAVADKREP